MVTVITREPSNFRIEIKDLRTKKVRSISLRNHSGKTLEDIRENVIRCIKAKTL